MLYSINLIVKNLNNFVLHSFFNSCSLMKQFHIRVVVEVFPGKTLVALVYFCNV